MIDLIADRVWLAAGCTDMRKSIDGLAAIVKYEMGLDPLEPAIFVFCGRRRDRIKLLYWTSMAFGCCTSAWKKRASGGLRREPNRFFLRVANSRGSWMACTSSNAKPTNRSRHR